MAFRVDYTPPSAAPALYGAALSAGQEKFRQQRQQEAMQLAEMQQRAAAQQQQLQANLYNQAASRQFNAQQAGLDRQFRAQQMQFGAEQDFVQQQQQFLQQQEQEQDQWFNQQEESGALIRDAASRMKIQKLFAQQGSIRSAQNLTPQDKQMKLMELDQQIRAERRGGLREPLPGERQKSMQEKWSTEAVKVEGPNGEITYVSPDRNGAFREVTGFEPPKETKGKTKISGTRTITTIDANGMPKTMTVPKTVDDILAEHAQQQEAQRLIEQLDVPMVEQEADIAQIPVGQTFQSPDGDYFQRTPEGYEPIDNPLKPFQDRAQARAAEVASNQNRLIMEAAQQKKAEEQAKQQAERALKLEDERRQFIQSMMGKSKPKAEGSLAAPKNYSAAEAAAMWEEAQAALRGEAPKAEPAPVETPPAAPGLPPMPPVPTPATEAEYNALPSGSLYRFTDGRIMRKP